MKKASGAILQKPLLKRSAGVLHCLFDGTLGVAVLTGLTLVVEVFALGKGDLHLCQPILQIHADRNQSISLEAYLVIELADL